MNKKERRLFLTVLAASLPVWNMVAQLPGKGVIDTDFQTKTSIEQAKDVTNQSSSAETNPLLSLRKELTPRHSDFPDASMPVMLKPSKKNVSNVRKASANTTIWANLASKYTWNDSIYGPFGYYSFAPTNPIVYKSIYDTNMYQIVAKDGIQYVDGHIYGVYATSNLSNRYRFDTNVSTGKTTRSTISAKNIIALETAQAVDETVYGEFYNSDATALEWATVDFKTRKRLTTIGPATHIFVALGITKEGQLYGVATDGNLYKVDRKTGKETLVGPTGVTVANSDGGYYAQTGEIDPKDNTFYWAAIDANTYAALYEVDLATGAATKIANTGDVVYGMLFPAIVADGAPAKATNAKLSFTGGELKGTVTFTAPSKSYGGTTLTDELTYTVMSDFQVLATGKVAPGKSVSAEVSVPESGTHQFIITTSNEAGTSPLTKVSKWIGFDRPKTVGSVTVSQGEGNTAIVKWTAPTTGVNSGALGSLTYTVYRIVNKDTTTIAVDIPELTITDTITSTRLAYYYYGVKAKSEGQESDLKVSTSGVKFGEYIEPDWIEDFDTTDDIKLFTIVDSNADKNTWVNWTVSGNRAVRCNYSNTENNDDWLITPPLHLTPGCLYNVKFKAWNSSAKYPGSFEVKWGNDTAIASLKNTIMPTTSPNAKAAVYSYDIKVPTEGIYYIGFHGNSVKGMYSVYLDSIVVERGALYTSPQAVTNFVVTPASKGALEASLKFNVATKNIDGGGLEKVDSLQILRNGALIATLPEAGAGISLSYNDTVQTSGTYKYTIIPFLDGSKGLEASASAFIGQDIPASPSNVTLLDNQSNILSLWSKYTETGAKGGYIDPSKVSVSLFTLEQGTYGYVVGDSLTTSAKGANRVNIAQDTEETTASDGKTQVLYQLAARANGEAGNSGYVMTDALVIGPTITIPYKESLKDGELDNGFVWTHGNSQYASNTLSANWHISTETSSDGDGGSFLWSAYKGTDSFYGTNNYIITAGDEVSINTPKVTLDGKANPKLYFDLNATVNDPAKLKVLVQTPDGVDHELKTYDLTATTTAGWTTQSVDLGQYKSQRYIIVKFLGIAEGSDTYVGIDNINIFDQLDKNLKTNGISVPKSVTAGKTGKVDVFVENYGKQPAKDYMVVLYANGEPTDSVTVSHELNVIATDTITLNLPVAINQKENISVKAVVKYEGDADLTNNETPTKIVEIKVPEYATVKDLTASNGSTGVSLSWTKPAKPAPVTVTEGFESYDAFATEFGEWTMIDGDKGLAAAFFKDYSYPGQGTAFAFDAFNPDAITQDFSVTSQNPGVAPHAGKQYAAAPHATNNAGSAYVAPDNWLISPELSGKKQTISFYAMNLATSSKAYTENFDVLYSKGTTDQNDFVLINSNTVGGTTPIGEGSNWKQFRVELPDSARFFAIHHNSAKGLNYLFGLDDITYEKQAVGANDSIVAYNIYRDGEFIGTVSSNALAYSDELAGDGNHVYNITVIYESSKGDRNESAFSNDAKIIVTGIDSLINNGDMLYNVYTLDGRAVMLNARSIKDLPKGIYIINDQKYVIK